MRYWIWMTTRKGLTPRGCLRVLASFGDPEAAFLASDAELAKARGLTAKDRAALADRDLSLARRIEADCVARSVGILTIRDPRYPALLRQISDPPAVLYYLGTLPDFDESLTLGVVGQRTATQSGVSAAYRMGKELSEEGCIVVSGCAAGIDCAAMEGALAGGSPVVGVLGCGVDVVYPAESRHLYRQIPKNGCLISEYPPGTAPDRWNFPARNRILSGLCRGVVVVEAPQKSGSLNTARHALEQGRDVFAMPGKPGDPNCAGSNDLLRQGASFAENGRDVLADYRYLFPERPRQTEKSESFTRSDTYINGKEAAPEGADISPSRKSFDKKDVDKRNIPPYIDVKEAPAGLLPEEAAILQSLQRGPMPVDLIVNATGIPAQRILSSLTMLEIKGLILRLPGGSCALKNR